MKDLLFFCGLTLIMSSLCYAVMDSNRKAAELLDNFWKWRMQNSPEFATFCGNHDYDDKLEIYTLEALEERKIMCGLFLNDCLTLSSEADLDQGMKESLDFLAAEIKTYLDGYEAAGYFFPLNYLEGVHLEFERLIEAMRFETIEDFDKLLSRYKSLPLQISQIIDLMRHGVKQGMTFHRISIDGIPNQIQNILDEKLEESAFYKPFLNISKFADSERQKTILSEAVNSISQDVMPAFKKLKDFIEEEYMTNTRPEIGASTLPNGSEFYQACLDFHLSYRATPEEVHDIGLKEVERIETEMKKVIESLELNISVKEFSAKLRNDKGFYFNHKDELLETYKGLVFNEIHPLLPKLFKNIPEAKLEIKFSSASMAQAPAAYYLAGTFDGKRPGVFYINAEDIESAPKYETVALALHEAVPGHHLQTAYLLESKNLPEFRKNMEDRKYSDAPSHFPLNTAYVEGWGLYCEELGYEMGLYDDPYLRYGQLSMEMLRATRLVVDTGMHAFGWSAERAVNYMLDHTALTRNNVENEVNRYITWPGQACAYKIGQLKIKSLRAMAEKEMGSKFNIQEFHDIVLQYCGPLVLLEQRIMQYIKENE